MNRTDYITVDEARSLPGLFLKRVQRSTGITAYHQYDPGTTSWNRYTWGETAREVGRWQAALEAEGLKAGDRIGIMLRNCREWVLLEQAALGLGMVVVPLYTNDRAGNVAYIVNDATVKLLLIEGGETWHNIREARDQFGPLKRIVTLQRVEDPDDDRLLHAADWLPAEGREPAEPDLYPQQLATIVYTSGTTGRPKGVMLSHHNILWNAWASTRIVPVYTDDLFLSFLPLSHMFERTVGHYIPILAGAQVAYARSIPELAEDLRTMRPTVLISVPRIFERVYNKIQAGLEEKPPLARRLFQAAVDVGWQRFQVRQKRAAWSPRLLLHPLLHALVGRKVMAGLGGRLRVSISGGAPLSVDIARTFIGLGLELIQGYGLTETSPVISANPPDDNDPASVGVPLPDVEVRIGEDDELLVRSPGVMLGYWNNDEATRAAIDRDGWFHTGDQARIERDHIYITGRIKEILVLANGEKVPPADVEMAIANDPLFEQVMVVGEGRPYMAAIAVLEQDHWRELARSLDLDPDDPAALTSDKATEAVLDRIHDQMKAFPGYAQIYRVILTLEPWTVEDGLITPTLKLRRKQIMERFADRIEALYAGH